MHAADGALLLQTVLGECGCVDATLQRAAHTVPFVYYVVAEQSFYVIYAVSVVKALLHERDAAFAHLARWQAARGAPSPTQCRTQSSEAAGGFTEAEATDVPVDLPAIAPSDSLDLSVTIVGGGTCCKLLLRLLCEPRHAAAPFLVHPSHLTVVTRQPERLARFAQRGVHCLRRHRGQSAVGSSDVVLLMCPPALFQEAVRDLTVAPTTTAPEVDTAPPNDSSNSRKRGTTALNSSALLSSSLSSTSPAVLQPTAVLVSCMAGVPPRKVALTFRRTPELTLLTRVYPHDGIVADEAVEGGRGGQLAGEAATGPPPALPPSPSLEHVALCYQDAMDRYREARVQDMRSNISFLRPAVLEQKKLTGAMAANGSNDSHAVRITGGGTWCPTERRAVSDDDMNTRSGLCGVVDGNGGPQTVLTSLAAPRLTDFTAGRDVATAPSLDGFLDIWRVLQAYVRTSFAEALKTTRLYGHEQQTGGSTSSSSGLICVVLPHNAEVAPRAAGEVEAKLLPALTLLPASKTVALWDAWWRNGLYSRPDTTRSHSAVSSRFNERCNGSSSDDDGDDSIPPPAAATESLSLKVTSLTGEWLSAVYATDAALLADLEWQYQHVLERQLPCRC
ncbi:hypothetical protein N2W54_000574 [Lotmaria passim]